MPSLITWGLLSLTWGKSKGPCTQEALSPWSFEVGAQFGGDYGVIRKNSAPLRGLDFLDVTLPN